MSRNEPYDPLGLLITQPRHTRAELEAKVDVLESKIAELQILLTENCKILTDINGKLAALQTTITAFSAAMVFGSDESDQT